MAEVGELDCKIFVEAEQSPEWLAELLAASFSESPADSPMGRTVQTHTGEIEVRRNKEADKDRARALPDGFLYFSYALELYPFSHTPHDDRVMLVASILNILWAQDLPAVATCDYEDELPNAGGYNVYPAPWALKAANPVEAGQ
jgi:hypothetical protein